MSKDPLGHIRLAVTNLEQSTDFYDKLLNMLGGTRVAEKGWCTKEGLGIWLIQAAYNEPKYVFEAPGLHHLCLKMTRPEEVDALHAQLLQRNVPIVTPPAHYPQYTEEYYAIFFLDPDGMKLEVAYY